MYILIFVSKTKTDALIYWFSITANGL